MTRRGHGGTDEKMGRMPSEQEMAKRQRVRPIMSEILQAKGLDEVASEKVLVTGLKGPLEDDWRQKVAALADLIPIQPS